MKNLSSFLRNFKLPRKSEINIAFYSFSKKKELFLSDSSSFYFEHARYPTIHQPVFMVSVPLREEKYLKALSALPLYQPDLGD